MAILFTDTTTVKAWSSGTGRYARELASSLARRHTVLTPSQSWNPHEPSSPLSKVNYHSVLNFSLMANRKNVHADACFFPNYFMPPGWPYPSAVTIHDVSFLTHPRFYSRKMSLYYKTRIHHTIQNARLILTVSEASKRSIAKHLHVPADRIIVHPPAPPVTAEYGLPSEKSPYLLYIGNLEPKKNIVRMLESFDRILNKNGHKLLLLGRLRGPRSWQQKVQRLIRDSADIYYKGYVPDEQIPGYLAHASGLVLLSHVEGFGLPAMDALANGISVLISRDPALNEVCGGSGIMVDECDTADITRGMEYILFSGTPPANISASIHERYGQKRYDEKLDEITERLTAKTSWFFPSDIGMSRDSRPEISEIKLAILAAVCYAAVFKSGITVHKLHHALGSARISFEDFLENLRELMDTHPDLLNHSTGVIGLNDSLLDQPYAENRTPDAADMRTRHRRLLKLFLWLPWVKGLYYSGGTVHGSGLQDQHDLDLLIVASRDRAWLAYAAIRLISRLAGAGSSICANYILDERAQEVHWQRDYYTAFQLLFLRKVVLKPGLAHIRQYNPWIYDYFPNSPMSHSKPDSSLKKGRGFLKIVNLLIMMAWTSRWKKKGLRSSEEGLLFDAYRIKLHTNDHRPRVSHSFSSIYSNVLKAFSTLPVEEI
ncbi:MAG: glycosyltransferase family 1 protein [Balneolaceae bacterium]|nr:MAG: glycosyltransferase family 1 protein [Balneolaceae bacterium]